MPQIYTIFQTLVLSHCKRLSHFEALWFAGVANSILWWTFVKACFNAMLAKLGAPSPLSVACGTAGCLPPAAAAAAQLRECTCLKPGPAPDRCRQEDHLQGHAQGTGQQAGTERLHRPLDACHQLHPAGRLPGHRHWQGTPGLHGAALAQRSSARLSAMECSLQRRPQGCAEQGRQGCCGAQRSVATLCAWHGGSQ